MKKFLMLLLMGNVFYSQAQELYIFSEPASNMPAKSMTAKLSAQLMPGSSTLKQRYTPEWQVGFHTKFMAHVGTSFSNIYQDGLSWDGAYVYGQYRFLSVDDVHKHFRMAVFAEASVSKDYNTYDEINLRGDKSGIKAGIIATQLWHKFALSGTVSNTQVLNSSRFDKVYYIPERHYQALNYSLSAGYLLLPKEYTSYKQLNVNLYAELLGQKILDGNKYYVDLAPALQFIVNSNAKINLGYRFQLNGNMHRMGDKSYYLSFERTFFNALKK